jgi:3-dehydroquinate synthase
MSDLKATVQETSTSSGHVGFHVEGYEKIEYDFTFIDGIFDVKNTNLADCYKKWKRCLAVTDLNIHNLYGPQMKAYFEHHEIELKVHTTKIGEKAKTIPTLLSIVDSMNEFGIYRKVRTLVYFLSGISLMPSLGASSGCRRWTRNRCCRVGLLTL